jgi:hypothetical protein
MEIPVVTEGEEIEFQALRLHHSFVRDIEDFDFREVWLSGNRTERRELRTVELHPVVVVRVFVLKRLQYLWCIVHPILGLLTKLL